MLLKITSKKIIWEEILKIRLTSQSFTERHPLQSLKFDKLNLQYLNFTVFPSGKYSATNYAVLSNYWTELKSKN